jgi:hypothetical protein
MGLTRNKSSRLKVTGLVSRSSLDAAALPWEITATALLTDKPFNGDLIKSHIYEITNNLNKFSTF